MEHVFVKEMQPGGSIDQVMLVKSASSRTTSKGSPYLAVTVADKTGDIECRFWDQGECLVEAGDFARVRASVSSYQGEVQLTLQHLKPVQADSIDMGRYLPRSKREPAEMLDDLGNLIWEHCNRDVRGLLNAVLEKATTAGLLDTPAAKSNHHAYVGGLVEHMLSMAGLAVRVCDHYEAQYPGALDKSLVIAGVVLHDIGKVYEQDPLEGYTDEGQLVGHIAIGLEMLLWAAAEVEGMGDTDLGNEQLDQLKHLILSHHGRKEYGSPVEPRTAEAHVLHLIDMIDSRMNMIAGAVEDVDEGWTEKVYPLGGPLYVGEGA